MREFVRESSVILGRMALAKEEDCEDTAKHEEQPVELRRQHQEAADVAMHGHSET